MMGNGAQASSVSRPRRRMEEEEICQIDPSLVTQLVHTVQKALPKGVEVSRLDVETFSSAFYPIFELSNAARKAVILEILHSSTVLLEDDAGVLIVLNYILYKLHRTSHALDVDEPTPSCCPEVDIRTLKSLPTELLECYASRYGSVQRNKCAAVWHSDHMAYRCRTCGLSDSSCMCLDCFDPADHVGHDYRVYSCASGGCCDCGDPFAWDPNGFCKKHRHDATASTIESDLTDNQASHINVNSMDDFKIHSKSRSEEEVASVGLIIKVVIQYLVEVLQIVQQECLPANYPKSTSPTQDAMDLLQSLFPETKSLVTPVELQAKAGQLKSRFSTSLQIHFTRLEKLLEWLQCLSSSCRSFRDIMVSTLLDSWTPLETNLDVLLKNGVLLPVEINDALGVLYLRLLFDADFKQRYTRHFVTWYPYLIEVYMSASRNGLETGMKALSKFLDRLFCQLFHSLTQLEELEEHFQEHSPSPLSVTDKLLTYLVHKLQVVFKTARRDGQRRYSYQKDSESSTGTSGTLAMSCTHPLIMRRSYGRLCSDIRTLVMHPQVATNAIRSSFDSGMDDGHQVRDESVWYELVQSVAALHYMDVHSRKTGLHVEFEGEGWTHAFIVAYEMNQVIQAIGSGLLSFRKSSEAWTRALISPLLKEITHWSIAVGCTPSHSQSSAIDVHDRSLHLSLHRLLTGVLIHLSDGQCLVELINKHMSVEEQKMLLQAPLELLLFTKEIHAGLWARNGTVMQHQLAHYHNRNWRYQGLLNDYCLLQATALVLPPGSLIAQMRRSSLLSLDEDEEMGEKHVVYWEQCLTLIAQIISSPVKLMMTRGMDESIVQREVAHWLALLAPCTRSDVEGKMDARLLEQVAEASEKDEEEMLSDALRACGEYTNPQVLSSQLHNVHVSGSSVGSSMSGKWTLRTEWWERVSSLYEGFTMTESHVLEQKQKRKQEWKRDVYLSESWREYQEQLAHQVLNSLEFMSFALDILSKWKNQSTEWEAVASKLVYLIDCGQELLREELVGPTGTFFDLLRLEEDVGETETRCILSYLVDMTHEDSSKVSEELQQLVQRLLTRIKEKSTACAQYLEDKSKKDPVSIEQKRSSRSSSNAKQRQEEILARMRERQQQFIQSQMALESDDEEMVTASVDDIDAKSDEEDEWGFPTGPLTLDLYLSHIQSGIQDQVHRILPKVVSTNATSPQYKSHQPVHGTMKHYVTQDNDPPAFCGLLPRSNSCDTLPDRPTVSHTDEECVLCRLPCRSDYGTVALILSSSILSKLAFRTPTLSSSSSSARANEVQALDAMDSIVWSCGHVLHQQCLDGYLKSLREQKRSRQTVGNAQVVDENDGEFMCPMCRRLGNVLLPCLSTLSTCNDKHAVSSFVSFLQTQMLRDDAVRSRATSTISKVSFDEPKTPSWLRRASFSLVDTSIPYVHEYGLIERQKESRATVHRFFTGVQDRKVRATFRVRMLVDGQNSWLSMNQDAAMEASLRDISIETAPVKEEWRVLLTMLLKQVEMLSYAENRWSVSLVDPSRLHTLQQLVDLVASSGDDSLDQMAKDADGVLFGRQVLFEEETLLKLYGGQADSVDDMMSMPVLLNANVVNLLLVRGITQKRMSTMTLEPMQTMLSETLYNARVVASVLVLQAVIAVVMEQNGKSGDTGSFSSPNFDSVDALEDAAEYIGALLVRCRLLQSSHVSSSICLKDHVSEKLLPRLRDLHIVTQSLLPYNTEDILSVQDEPEHCAVCDSLFPVMNNASAIGQVNAILRVFHLPSLSAFFRQDRFAPLQRSLVDIWSAQLEASCAVLRRHDVGILDVLQDKARCASSLLIPLPRVYMDMFVKYAGTQCSRCSKPATHPAICLLCGTSLCCFKTCCQGVGAVGECTRHVQECSGGLGAVLLLKACAVMLFLGNDRRCVWGSLYVDKNGEEDPYLRRGKTLYLDEERARALELLLLSHGFNSSSAVLANVTRREGKRY